MSDRVILLEFNELTPTLLDDYFEKGLLPNFKRLYDESHVYITDAEAEGELLNPWVQWVTVHTGLSADEHGLDELNQGHLLDKPRVWDLVSRAGKMSFVCGSMNVAHDDDLNGMVIPDPWSTTVPTYPPDSDLGDFYRFVQMQVQEHTNESVPLDKGDYARFVKFMVAHGMSVHTITSIMKQLAGEKAASRGRWRRAVLLDKLQFDVFRWVFEKRKPHFATIFLNSTAHMQHAYWRHMDPDAFTMRPSADEQAEYGGAVLFGYEEMDKLIGRVLDLAGTDTTIVFTSALGQQPYVKLDEEGGKHFYRPRKFEDLTAFAGLDMEHRCSPVMSEQFHVYLESEADGDAAWAKLDALTVDGEKAMALKREDEKTILAGCGIFTQLLPEAVLSSGTGESAPFYDIFYSADTVKSGMHHPDGVFWIRTPAKEHSVHEERVSLRSVAPTLLELMGLDVPEHMSAPAVRWQAEAIAG